MNEFNAKIDVVLILFFLGRITCVLVVIDKKAKPAKWEMYQFFKRMHYVNLL